MATDPLCGMHVDETKTPHSLARKGKRYYFCSSRCKNAFLRKNTAKQLAKEKKQLPDSSIIKTTLSITGMHCASCSQTIEKGLKKYHGVTDASVNYATEQATITHDSTIIEPDTLILAITKIGYGAHLL